MWPRWSRTWEPVLKTLDRLNENFIGALTQVDQKGKDLSAGLTRAGGAITVHEYAQVGLDRVIAGIHAQEGHFQAQLPEKCPSAELSHEDLESLRAQYTMMDERTGA